MAWNEGACKEVMEKTEWVAIVTQGKAGPHLVATWGNYLRIRKRDDLELIVIPVGHYYKTEANLKNNQNIQLLIASRQVKGSYGLGQGFLLQGSGEILTDGEFFLDIKKQFSWARGALVIKVKEAKAQL